LLRVIKQNLRADCPKGQVEFNFYFKPWYAIGLLTPVECIELFYIFWFRKGEIEKAMKIFFPSSLQEREQLNKCVKRSTEKDQLQHQQLSLNMVKRRKHI